MSMWRSFRLFFVTHWRGLSIVLMVIIGLFISLNAGFHVVSSNEATCAACHVMDPYMRSWEHSTHEGVDCIKCHDLEFTYFTDALIKNTTGSYDPRLRANVKNESCLQSGCHSLEVVERASGFGSSVAFDHSTHLTELRRGEKLRCTSCHTTDPTGENHFSTDADSCYICHFKGAEAGRSITGCDTCHTVPPKEVEHGGFRFDHEEYTKLGVSCEECHVQITRGDAEVSQSRCNDCHVERLESFGDFRVMHDTHVTEEGIGCFRCHNRIEHSAVAFVSTLDVGCDNCHGPKHGEQKQMYMGVGGQGQHDIPSRMFAAKVSCEGCHLETLGGGAFAPAGANRMDTLRASCVRCHEQGYDTMLDVWVNQMSVALAYAAPAENRARNLLQRLDREGVPEGEFKQLIRDGLWNINLVRQGHGVHNVEYAVKLVNTSIEQFDLAFKHYGDALGLGNKPEVLRSPDGYCMALCHSTLNTHGVQFFAEMEIYFDHDSHTHTACTTCHSAEKHKEKVISKDGCMDCHHTPEAQESYGVGCADCHTAVDALYLGTASVQGVEIAADSMSESDVGCLDCHGVQAHKEGIDVILGRCNTCHTEWGVEPEKVNDVFVQQEVGSRQRTDRLILRIETLKERVRRGGVAQEISDKLATAEGNLDIVLKGRAHHNWVATDLILSQVEKSLGELENQLNN